MEQLQTLFLYFDLISADINDNISGNTTFKDHFLETVL